MLVEGAEPMPLFTIEGGPERPGGRKVLATFGLATLRQPLGLAAQLQPESTGIFPAEGRKAGFGGSFPTDANENSLSSILCFEFYRFPNLGLNPAFRPSHIGSGASCSGCMWWALRCLSQVAVASISKLATTNW